MADEFVPVALAEEEEEFTPVALAEEESDFTPVGFAEDEQPVDTRRVRGEAFKMLNDAGRLSPRLQRDIADESSGIVGGALKAGKNVLGGIAETVGEAVANPFTKTEAFTMNELFGEGGKVADDLKVARDTVPSWMSAQGKEKTRETIDNFVKFFEGNGITDGKQMMEVLKDSIRENTWDPTTDDNARVLSDGSLRVNPKFVALPDAQAGIDAIMAAPVDDETRQQEVENFKAARKTAAAALDTKTKAFDEDYRTYAAEQAAKGVTDPEQVFFGWPGLDRNFIEGSWDVIRDTVAEAGRGIAQTGRGAVAGVGEKLGLEGLVEGVGREMLASSEKSGFVKEIATARGQEGAVLGTGKELGNTVLQMVPMFVGAGVGRVVAGAAEAGTAKRILGNITAGTSVYGYAGAQGYSSIMQQALDTAQRDAEAQGRELTGAEINATVEKFQGAALANGLQTAVLAKLLPEGAEKAALNGLAAQAGQLTGRDVFAAMRAKYGKDGVRAAVMAAKPELVEFAKQAYRAGKVGFKDEAIEEGVNQFLEGTIVKMSGADPDKTWDEIGQETWKGAWMGGVVGGGLPVATKTLAATDPAERAARQLAAGAQDASPASAEAALEDPLDVQETPVGERQTELPVANEAQTSPLVGAETATPVAELPPPNAGTAAPDPTKVKAIHFSREPLSLERGKDLSSIDGRYEEESSFGPGFYAMAPEDEKMWTEMDRFTLGPNRNEVEIDPKNPLVIDPETIKGLDIDKISEDVRTGVYDAVFIRGFGDEDVGPEIMARVEELWSPKFEDGKSEGRFINGDEYDAAVNQATQEILGVDRETFEKLSRGGWLQNQIFIPADAAPDVVSASPTPTNETTPVSPEPAAPSATPAAEEAQVPASDAGAVGGVKPYSPEALKDTFDLSPEQSVAVDALVQAMGLDTSRIQLKRGGVPGAGAMAQTQTDLAGHEMTREAYDASVATLKPKPREVFYVGDVEVIRNPSDSDRRRMSSEVRSEFGRDISGDPATRFTKDTSGNTWIWKAHQGIHSQIEPGISSREGVPVNQNSGVPTHAELVRDAIRAKKPIPAEVQAQYPQYAEFFAELPLFSGNAQDAKGSFEQLPGTGDILLRGLTNPDVSTAVHELAHAARRTILNREVPAENRAGITDEDIAITEKWAGAKGGNWNVDAEEKFARGLERYLRDGQAPVAALQGVFDKIGEWLRQIYQTVAGGPLDVEISDAMRAVFDKLVTRNVAAEPTAANGQSDPQVAETQQLVALDAQIEQDLEPPIPEPEFNAPQAAPGQSPTGIKHAIVDVDRERLGLPPRFRPNAYTDQAAWDRAIAAEDAHRGPGTAGSKLLENLIREGPRALTKDESALLLHEKLLREDAVDTAQSALNRAGADGRQELQGAVKAALEQFTMLADYVDAAGSKSGLSLQARKMMVNRDYSLASVAREMHAAKNLNAKEPVPWTDADQAKAAEVAKKLQETQARLDQVTEENTELTAAVERLTRDVEQAQAKLGVQVRETRLRKLVKEKLDPLAAEAKARLQARGKIRPSETETMLSGLDPEAAQDIRDMATVAAAWFADKTLTIAEFGAKLVSTFGDWAKDHIDAVFAKSQSLFAETAASVSGGSAPTPEQVRDAIDPETDLEKQDVWDLARAHVIAGARGRNVLENVFNDLSPLFPELTRDRVAVLFTDYGTTSGPSDKPVAQELQRVKSLERIALKLADVRAGRMPKRTGFQRGDQDAEIRELEKQFREEYRALEEDMRAKGIPFEDSERRLKTALGAVKRRMRNEIEEIERSIASGEARNAAVRQPVQYDQEAIDLRARLETKRAEYDATFSKESTREKRVAAAIKTLDRQIAEEAKMLADGVLKKAKGEQVTSPEIETRREQLRQMRQNRRDLYAAQNPGEAEADAMAAAKKAAQKAIERLGAAVASGDVAVKKKDPAYTPDAELTALIEARETLSDMVAEMRRALPATPEQEAAKEKRMLAAAEATLRDLDAKLAAGDLSVKAPKGAASAPASVAAVREKIKAANRQLDARRREAGVGPYSMDAKIQRQLGNVNKRLAEYQRRIREKDFSKKTAVKPVTSAEILDAEFEAAKAKAEYQEMLNKFKLANATFGKKAGYYLFSTNNLLKLLTLGFDIGVLTRQLGTTYQSVVRDMGMFAPTAEGARLRAKGSYVLGTIRAGARAFMDPKQELEIYKAVSTRPNAGWDKAAGLIFGAPFDDQAGTREDVPTANFIETIPWWVWPAIAGAKVALVGVSPPVAALLIGTSLVQKRLLIALDRAQRAMTNQSRALWFDHALENLPDAMQTAESAKVLGTAVMVGTGRGVLPKSMEGMVPAANMILLATRFYISRIQSLLYGLRTAADVSTGFLATPKATKAARQEVAKMYARSVTGRALLLMLAAWGFGKSLGGDDEEDKGVVLDPFNPDFGRVKLAEKTKLDFMSGINGFMGVMLRVGFERKTDPATGRKEVLSPTDLGREVTNFFASKRNLQISFLWNTHKGEYYGGKAVNFENALEEATTAIIINDTVNAFKELGPAKGAALTALMLTGAGTSVGDAREEEAQRKADKAAATLERKRREAELNQ
jgi:hypothetical protein